MKKFYLYGDTNMNAGPCNVNRSWIENSDGSMDYPKSKGRIARRIEKLWGCITHSVIVFSGGTKKLELHLAKMLGKRIVYIMHGCNRYENTINKLGMTERDLKLEYDVLSMADIIVAVSEMYAEWAKREFPEFANKVTFVNNGLEISKKFFEHTPHTEKKYSIAVSGGNRPIKCNLEVCKAIEKLQGDSMNIEMKAFGRFHDNGEPILKYHFVKPMGQMNKEDYYEELKSTDLYVIASDTESFGLVVGDAINCGCSLLLSKYVGAASIFKGLTSEDVLNDNHNTDEIALKIRNLLLHGNAQRLYDAIDIEKCSGKQAFINLKNICLDE